MRGTVTVAAMLTYGTYWLFQAKGIGGFVDWTYMLATINPIVIFTFSLIFFLIWRQQPSRTYILNWSLGYLAAGIGFSFEFIYHFVPTVPLIVGINVSLPLSALFIVRGLCLRYAQRAPDRLLLAIIVYSGLALYLVSYVANNSSGRGLAVASGMAALLCVSLYAMSKYRGRDKIDHCIALSTLAITALLVARPIGSYFLDTGPSHQIIEMNSFTIVSLKIIGLFSWMTFAIFFLLRIAADLLAEVNAQSVTDPLSNILNRRGFFAAAEVLAISATASLPVSVLLLDIDHFKKINDSYGHHVGDEVIKKVADVMRTCAPDGAVVGRLGGEEFAIVLSNTHVAAALGFAEALRSTLHVQSYVGVPDTHPVTASMGLVEGEGASLDQLIQDADAALYKAKNGGRDQVCLADHAVIESSICAIQLRG